MTSPTGIFFPFPQLKVPVDAKVITAAEEAIRCLCDAVDASNDPAVVGPEPALPSAKVAVKYDGEVTGVEITMDTVRELGASMFGRITQHVTALVNAVKDKSKVTVSGSEDLSSSRKIDAVVFGGGFNLLPATREAVRRGLLAADASMTEGCR